MFSKKARSHALQKTPRRKKEKETGGSLREAGKEGIPGDTFNASPSEKAVTSTSQGPLESFAAKKRGIFWERKTNLGSAEWMDRKKIKRRLIGQVRVSP